MVTMQELLNVMYEKGASDLHITTGIAPTIRVDGRLQPGDDVGTAAGPRFRALLHVGVTDLGDRGLEAAEVRLDRRGVAAVLEPLAERAGVALLL